jgi:serine phosphatase RsbU (regulator of sigma subunit)
MTTAPDSVHHSLHALECMEIWGSNNQADHVMGTPGLEVLVHSRPFQSDRGGDIHYVTLCASGKLTRTILADVAGHGSEVDAVARQLRDLLRKNINIVNQKRLVRDLNNEFSRVAAQSKFATAVVATLVSRRNLLTLCNAGHPRPAFYSAHQKTWRLLTGEEDTDGDLPLGIAAEVPYSQFAISFCPGDILLMYTDGLLESTNESGEQLGEAGILRLLDNLPIDALQETATTLSQRLQSFRGDAPVADDMTWLLLRHTGDITRAYIIPRKLKSYGKLLGLLPV